MQEIHWNDFHPPGEYFCKWLLNRDDLPTVIVCEDWRTRPFEEKRHAHTWSDHKEARIIGILLMFAYEHGIEFALQPPSIKPVGYGNAGLKYTPGRKGTHIQDAVAHGVYWYVNTYVKEEKLVSR